MKNQINRIKITVVIFAVIGFTLFMIGCKEKGCPQGHCDCNGVCQSCDIVCGTERPGNNQNANANSNTYNNANSNANTNANSNANTNVKAK